MPSAKQIAWRKKFARMSKAGKFKKKSANMKKGMKYFDSQKYADGTPFGKSKKSELPQRISLERKWEKGEKKSKVKTKRRKK